MTNYDRLAEAARAVLDKSFGCDGPDGKTWYKVPQPEIQALLAELDAQGEGDALREAKREAWEEGLQAGADYYCDNIGPLKDNPYGSPRKDGDPQRW